MPRLSCVLQVHGLHTALAARRELLTGGGNNGPMDTPLAPSTALFAPHAEDDREALCDWLTEIGCFHVLPALSGCGVKSLADMTLLSQVDQRVRVVCFVWRLVGSLCGRASTARSH